MTTISIIALLFAVAGFLLLWFGPQGRVQLLGAAILAAALVILLAGLASRPVIHIGATQPTDLPSHRSSSPGWAASSFSS